jgi:MFS family permease
MKRFPFLTRNIIILCLVSFFTDIASEMLYPVMPLYLSAIGYGAFTIGIIEGIAEAIAGLNKVFFGSISDKLGKRNLFVKIGYGISAFSKPLIGLSASAPFIFFIRFLDRVGKGIRTSPRDAILTAESKPEFRGRVFGFHRSLDTAGAMLGPIITLAFLWFFPMEYSKVFLYALVPGVLAFAATMYLSKEKNIVVPQKKRHTVEEFKKFWKKSSLMYRKLIVGFLMLAILNSSNAFLLLRAKELGFPDAYVIGSYIFYNLIFMLVSYPLGAISDKIGFKPVFIGGVLAFSLVYAVLGSGFTSPILLFALFGLYGIFSAADEGVGKAWLTLHIVPEYKATGLGLHLTLNSLGFLLASVLTGLVWQLTGAKVIFSVISILGLFVIGYFMLLKEKKDKAV